MAAFRIAVLRGIRCDYHPKAKEVYCTFMQIIRRHGSFGSRAFFHWAASMASPCGPPVPLIGGYSSGLQITSWMQVSNRVMAWEGVITRAVSAPRAVPPTAMIFSP